MCFSNYISKGMAVPQMKLCSDILINFSHIQSEPSRMKEQLLKVPPLIHKETIKNIYFLFFSI